MNIPEELRYTEEHEWVKLNGNVATVGITDFAQSELGDIVYLEIDTLDSEINSNDVFGTVEAVKTVSCLLYTSPSPRDLSTSRMPSSA